MYLAEIWRYPVKSMAGESYYLAFPRRGQGEAGPLPAYSMT